MRIPIYDPATVLPAPSRSPSPVESAPPSSATGGTPPESNMTTWEMWDTIRTICGYNPRLTLGAHIRRILAHDVLLKVE